MCTYKLHALQAIFICHSRCQMAIEPRFLGTGPGRICVPTRFITHTSAILCLTLSV